MTMEEIYEDMREEFERNHPLLTEMYKRYKTFQNISDEWQEIRKPIVITGASDRTEDLPELEWVANNQSLESKMNHSHRGVTTMGGV